MTIEAEYRERLLGRTQALFARFEAEDENEERINRWLEERIKEDPDLFVTALAAGGRWLLQQGQLTFTPW